MNKQNEKGEEMSVSGSPYIEGMDEVETQEPIKMSDSAERLQSFMENPLASSYIQGNKRLEGELYCDYKARLYWEHLVLKHALGGKVVWVGKQRGEARNPLRITRTTKGRAKKDRYNERLAKIKESQGKRTPEQVDVNHRSDKKTFVEKCNERKK